MSPNTGSDTGRPDVRPDKTSTRARQELCHLNHNDDENKVLKIFVSKREKATGKCTFLQILTRVIKSSTLRLTGHVARVREIGKKTSVEKPKEKRSISRTRRR
jgi:hypothetical protein